jgi:hypothetical protein
MIEEIDQKTFDELWNLSHELGCPFTHGHPGSGAVWLWNENSDPCITKKCGQVCCHSYGLGWNKYQKLLVPSTAKASEAKTE